MEFRLSCSQLSMCAPNTHYMSSPGMAVKSHVITCHQHTSSLFPHQGSVLVWAQPMRDVVTLKRRLLLAGRIPRLIPASSWPGKSCPNLNYMTTFTLMFHQFTCTFSWLQMILMCIIFVLFWLSCHKFLMGSCDYFIFTHFLQGCYTGSRVIITSLPAVAVKKPWKIWIK